MVKKSARRTRRTHTPAFKALALGADNLGGEQARAVQIEPRIEGVFVERVDGSGVLLRDVAAAHVLSDHAGVLALGQGVVVVRVHTEHGGVTMNHSPGATS